MKKNWYDWFINHISKSTRKGVNGFKDKIINLLRQTHLTKLCMEK